MSRLRWAICSARTSAWSAKTISIAAWTSCWHTDLVDGSRDPDGRGVGGDARRRDAELLSGRHAARTAQPDGAELRLVAMDRGSWLRSSETGRARRRALRTRPQWRTP